MKSSALQIAKIPKATSSREKPENKLKFIDWIRVHVKAGNGGDGSVSLLSLYREEFAGPDGGNGGNGGHVIFKANGQKNNLNHLKSRIHAPNGEEGMYYNRTGKTASHVVIDVPIGTVFRNMDRKIVAEVEEEGAMFLAARGGEGGKGNSFFKSAERQTPLAAEKGGQGEQFTFDVELRTMADVGLVGFPNAGKSTLLRALSRARPKVAAYPFTTLHPHIGMVPYPNGSQIAVADIPGLIPDAHKNKGLGIAFLRHIERCKILLYVLDLSVSNPEEQLEGLIYELEQYSQGLSKRPHAIIANKIDLSDTEAKLEQLNKWLSTQDIDPKVIAISAKQGQNIDGLKSYLSDKVHSR